MKVDNMWAFTWKHTFIKKLLSKFRKKKTFIAEKLINTLLEINWKIWALNIFNLRMKVNNMWDQHSREKYVYQELNVKILDEKAVLLFCINTYLKIYWKNWAINITNFWMKINNMWAAFTLKTEINIFDVFW